jgi:hypothetical protein
MAAVLRRTTIPRNAALGERAGRLAGRTAVIVGGGQTRGSTVGNGRAVALLFAQRSTTPSGPTSSLTKQTGGKAVVEF